ncbi:MAG TPA: rod-binding protein [Croceibacterium sp.]
MIAPVPPGAASPFASTPAGGSARERLTEAAQQFEAIFVRQMLAAARSTDFGGDDLFGGQGEDTFREMRDSQFAQIASETGALGLAKSIEAQLANHLGMEG